MTAWVRIDDGVPHHRKFLKAGPAASWLWLCGVAYCQRELSDGFIPREVIPTLGVERPRVLIEALVSIGLWDVVEGGWQVHDYLVHQKSRAQVEAIQQQRRGAAQAKWSASRDANRRQDAEVAPMRDAPTLSTKHLALSTEHQAPSSAAPQTETARDRAFSEFVEAYPAHRRNGGTLGWSAYIKVVTGTAGYSEAEMYAVLRERLALHKRSKAWADGFITGMVKWLQGEWTQTPADLAGATSPESDPEIARTEAKIAEMRRMQAEVRKTA